MRKYAFAPRSSARNRRLRIACIMAAFTAIFAAAFIRLVQLGMKEEARSEISLTYDRAPSGRPAIVDRNGQLLATDIPIASLYMEPRSIPDLDEAVEKLAAIFPELDARELHSRLRRKDAFTWVKRQIAPEKQQAIIDSGLAAVGFRPENQRLYPNGSLAAHVLGAVDIDNVGIAGIEKWIDANGLADLRGAGIELRGRELQPVELSIDLRVQYAMEQELGRAVTKFGAVAGAGLLLDVANGEILALASYPAFDPNNPVDAFRPDRINRVTAGVFEMGSTFKTLTTAMALESGRFDLESVVDASRPLSFGRQRIHDYRGQYRPLTIPEAFIHSSNIAMAKMALSLGPEALRTFLGRFGVLSRLSTELPESAAPLRPSDWSEVTTATVSFGHGIAVTPLQASMAVAALANGGKLIRPTFIKDSPVSERTIAEDLVSADTSEAIRHLLRLNTAVGSAKRADVPGYVIGGKTGTAEKVVQGRYSKVLNVTSFMGIVPADNPRYLLLALLDEPRGLTETYGNRTSGWNAVPLGAALYQRILPMLLTPAFPSPAGAEAVPVATGDCRAGVDLLPGAPCLSGAGDRSGENG
ncbi:peptidoglycan D,D-transpeptidase FtsI family protein [Sinorhizobium arboris]|uniref:peptidoglycan D,D-transpeptidase FtsI family protein n=1 Tax=Sinorhizobium arboris TaxID=76745 RepID=UPI001F2DCF39|nr:penicillin-binding protein 2 [Sinorhizobium arboris]